MKNEPGTLTVKSRFCARKKIMTDKCKTCDGEMKWCGDISNESGFCGTYCYTCFGVELKKIGCVGW